MQDFIAQLEAELEKSLRQRDAAKAAREHAAAEEAKWEQDVRALKNLISRRRNDTAHSDGLQPAAEGYSTANDPHFVSGFEELNRVEWVYGQLVKAGAAGMLPTELYEASKKAGFFMHKNYAYVATSKLVERGRAVKVGKRYRAIEKEVSSEEKTS
jgi:hypothetical protein